MERNTPNNGENSVALLLGGLGILCTLVCICLVVSILLVSASTAALSSRLSTLGPQTFSTIGPVRLTPFATPTSSLGNAPATAQAVAAWPVVISSNFDLNSDSWPTGPVSDSDYGDIDREISSGNYNWIINPSRGVSWYAYPQMQELSDFILSVEGHQTGGSEASYGLIFRRTNSGDYYSFSIDAGAQTFVFGRVQNGQWYGSDGRTFSNAINVSGTNKITIIAIGSHFTFYINDQLVAEYVEPTLKSGKAGIEMDVSEAAKDVNISYDNFDLRAPAGTPTPTLRPSATFTITPTPQPTLAAVAGRLAFANNGALFSINADGTDLQQLTSFGSGDSSPSWSPDGQFIAFSRGAGVNQIFIMKADGSDVTQITHTAFNETEPNWSPDGKQLAFTSDENGQTDIYLMDRDGSNRIRLTEYKNNDVAPAWRPDGQQIAYNDSDLGRYTINLISPQGLQQGDVRYSFSNGIVDPSWSPDGKRLAFWTRNNGNAEIYTVDSPTANNPVRLTNDSAEDTQPAWSPDGNFMAFVSDRDGPGDLYIMRVDGSQPTRITQVAKGTVTDPAWRP